MYDSRNKNWKKYNKRERDRTHYGSLNRHRKLEVENPKAKTKEFEGIIGKMAQMKDAIEMGPRTAVGAFREDASGSLPWNSCFTFNCKIALFNTKSISCNAWFAASVMKRSKWGVERKKVKKIKIEFCTNKFFNIWL